MSHQSQNLLFKSLNDNDVRAFRALSRKKFSYFVKECWPVIEPGVDLKWGWYLEAICEHLEAVANGDIKRLIVSLPPRHSKSTIISVMFPAWIWLRRPSARFLSASYAMKLATRDAVRSRRVMASDIYQLMRPDFVMTGDQNEKQRYENDRTGVRLVTAPGAGTTGEGGNFIMIDDPHNVQEVESETQRKEVHEWYDHAMSNRLNDPKLDSIIITAQRTHEDDLTGHLLSSGRFDHLCLPTLYEPEYRKPPTSIGFEDPRSEPGDLLAPDRFGADEVEDAQRVMGTWAFAAQHQQRPVAGRGNIFNKDWFRTWTTLPLEGEYIMSWDLAFKGRSERDEIKRVGDLSFVVGNLWFLSGASAYLVDETRGQWDFKATLEQFRLFCDRHPDAKRKLIEAKANAPALESVLHDEIPGIILVEPRGSKVQRAFAIQPYTESGNIYIPDKRLAPWVGPWLNEISAFPFGMRDDRVDAMTQIINFGFNSESSASMRRLKLLVSE